MTDRPPPPTPEQQLAFLARLQRLFAEGEFTATYKFALLMSLADLAIDLGADDGRELELTVRQIAERFIRLYWSHGVPYGPAGHSGGILVQNIGAQAAVVTAIVRFREASAVATLLQAQASPGYDELVTEIAATVSAQPLRYLQNFGGGSDPFLYERHARGRIRLRPGVVFCLRRFYPLVQQLCRNHWIDHIKANRRNHPLLGGAADLEDFLFAASRQSLALVGEELRRLEGARCFYCGLTLGEADVDHFIPFALYPRDLAANFVLAHPACNRSKSDTLAARIHLERWLERLGRRSSQLVEIGQAVGLTADKGLTHRVVAWAYAGAHAAGARAWQAPAVYEDVDDSYIRLLST